MPRPATNEVLRLSSEDCAKYFCALGSRSVRRVAAKVYAAADLDAKTRTAIPEEALVALQRNREKGHRFRWANLESTCPSAKMRHKPPQSQCYRSGS
jgi:hypothetical protein